ncbi:Pyrethroid hydrolase Ces2a [Fulvia fulva]|nr:Pyrethroid hydrolase Ces2a [Fulvia fulva]
MQSLLLTTACLMRLSGLVSATSPSVQIGAGTYVGTLTSVRASAPTANAYLGIPFAKPPVRFMPPVEALPVVGEFQATSWPPACIQQSLGFVEYNNTDAANLLTSTYNTKESEDCLYLNIFTSTNATKSSKLPVMFEIYGGNLQGGGSSLPIYNGASLAAEEDVVVVTIGYRVGPFGFVPSEEVDSTLRNPGFLDQRLALEWVHHNVEHFGGDSSRVTILGQSAGGYSVKQLWANPPNPLRFHAAIMESEGLLLTRNDWPNLVANLNCSAAPSPLECVRALPVGAVKDASLRDATGAMATNAFSILSFPPTVDYLTNTNRSEVAVATGKAARIPILIGSNGNESAALANGLNAATAAVAIPLLLNSTAVSTLFPTWYSSALAQGAQSEEQAVSKIVNNVVFNCPISILSQTASASDYSVWRYLYNATFADLNTYPDQIKYGAYHGAEVTSVFGVYPSGEDEAAQQALARYVQGIWAGFARTLGGSVPWAKVDTEVDSVFRIGQDNVANGSTIYSGVVDGECGLYDGYVLSAARV